MKGKTKFSIIGVILNIFMLIQLLHSGINYVVEINTDGHILEGQFWLFSLLNWILIYTVLSIILIILWEKLYPSKQKIKQKFYPKKKKEKYFNKKKAYLCQGLSVGGVFLMYISGYILCYTLALVPAEELKYLTPFGWILTIILLSGLIMIVIGGILGVKGALEKTVE